MILEPDLPATLRARQFHEGCYAFTLIAALMLGDIALYVVAAFHAVRWMVLFMDTSSRLAEITDTD